MPSLDSVISGLSPHSYISNLDSSVVDTGSLGLTWGGGFEFGDPPIVPSEVATGSHSGRTDSGSAILVTTPATSWTAVNVFFVHKYGGSAVGEGDIWATDHAGLGGGRALVRIAADGSSIEFYPGVGSNTLIVNYSFVVGQTYDILVTWLNSSQTACIYINGVLVGTQVLTGNSYGNQINWVWFNAYGLGYTALGYWQRMFVLGGSAALTQADATNLHNAFTGPDTVTVTSPNGGETLGTQQTITISGSASGSITTVDVDFTANSSAGTPTWTSIATNVPVNTSLWSATWAGPRIAGNDYKIRVTKHGDVSVVDLSNATFTISTSTVSVVAPVCSKIANYASAIVFNAFGLDTVDVKLSTDNGLTFPVALASGVVASNGFARFWVDSAYVSSTCQIRVTGAGGTVATTPTFAIVAESNSLLQPAMTPGGGASAFSPPGMTSVVLSALTVTAGAIVSLSVAAPGDGYITAPTVFFFDVGGGTGATGTAVLTSAGKVSYATVTNAGSGYTSAPTVSFTGGAGTGAAAIAFVSGGEVIAVVITNAGSGYTSNPTIGFSGGGGSGAAATAVRQFGVASVTITAGGSGYTGQTGAYLKGGWSSLAVPNYGWTRPPGDRLSGIEIVDIAAATARTDPTPGGDTSPGIECVMMRCNGGAWVNIPMVSLNSDEVKPVQWTASVHMFDDPNFKTIRPTQIYGAKTDTSAFGANATPTYQAIVIPFVGMPRSLSDLTLVANATGTTYYLSRATGTAGGAGTRVSPIDTVANAMIKASGAGVLEGLTLVSIDGDHVLDSASGTTGTITTTQPISIVADAGAWNNTRLIGVGNSPILYWQANRLRLQIKIDETDPSLTVGVTTVGQDIYFDGCEKVGAGAGNTGSGTFNGWTGGGGFYYKRCYTHDVGAGGGGNNDYDTGAVVSNHYNYLCDGKMGGESNIVLNYSIRELQQTAGVHGDIFGFIVCDNKVVIGAISDRSLRGIAALFPLTLLHHAFINCHFNDVVGDVNYSGIGGQSCLYAYLRVTNDPVHYEDHPGPNINNQMHACIWDEGVDLGTGVGDPVPTFNEATWTFSDYGSGTIASTDANPTSGGQLTFNADRTPVAGNTNFNSGLPIWPFDALNRRRGLYSVNHATARGAYAAAAEFTAPSSSPGGRIGIKSFGNVFERDNTGVSKTNFKTFGVVSAKSSGSTFEG